MNWGIADVGMRREDFLSTLARTIVLLLLLGIYASTASAKTYYIHADHIGTPKVVTDGNQTVVWKAAHDAFGQASVSIAAVENNLRFPGQYYDKETDLHYNYFRDYDPEIGRYLQSDPIGLEGGLNTYAYANNNPLKYVDPDGRLFQFAPGVAKALRVATIVLRLVLGRPQNPPEPPQFPPEPRPPATAPPPNHATPHVPQNLKLPNNPTVGVAERMNPHSTVNVPGILGLGSPSAVSDDILDLFCAMNPTAPNCPQSTTCP